MDSTTPKPKLKLKEPAKPYASGELMFDGPEDSERLTATLEQYLKEHPPTKKRK